MCLGIFIQNILLSQQNPGMFISTSRLFVKNHLLVLFLLNVHSRDRYPTTFEWFPSFLGSEVIALLKRLGVNFETDVGSVFKFVVTEVVGNLFGLSVLLFGLLVKLFSYIV